MLNTEHRWNNSDIQSEYNAKYAANENPFDATGGLSFTDVDMDGTPSLAAPHTLSTPQLAPALSPSKKRTHEDRIEEETESQELAFNAGTLQLDTDMQVEQTRRFMPTKRKLGKTQSLCVSYHVSPLHIILIG